MRFNRSSKGCKRMRDPNQTIVTGLRDTADALRKEAEEWEAQAAVYRRRADEIEEQAAEWEVWTEA